MALLLPSASASVLSVASSETEPPVPSTAILSFRFPVDTVQSVPELISLMSLICHPEAPPLSSAALSVLRSENPL